MQRQLFSLFFLILFFTVSAQQIDESKLRRDIYYLASPFTEGRGSGTPGEMKTAEYIASAFSSLGLLPKGHENSYFYTFEFTANTSPHGQNGKTIEGIGVNVAGYLDNGAEQTVVIGAHHDHLGRGEFGNSRQPDKEGYVFFGADDNASGVAGVLALAEYFSQNNRKENFNFLFICFSAEELGLIGSKRFVESPTYDLSRVNYMINMDMIGRLNNDKRLMVHGVGTADEWVPLLNRIKHNFSMSFDSSGIGPSDFTSFYLANIPVLHFYTGAHGDYHTIDDTPDKINYSGQAEVLRFIASVVEATESMPRLQWKETVNKQANAPRFKVTLGVMPDYAWSNAGLKLDGVTSGRPAEAAGMKQGDIILSIGPHQIKSVQDYMKILSTYEPGNRAVAKVLRGEDTLELEVVF